MHLPTEVIQNILIHLAPVTHATLEPVLKFAATSKRMHGITFDTPGVWKILVFPLQTPCSVVCSVINNLSAPSRANVAKVTLPQSATNDTLRVLFETCPGINIVDARNSVVEKECSGLEVACWRAFASLSRTHKPVEQVVTLGSGQSIHCSSETLTNSMDVVERRVIRNVTLLIRGIPFASIEYGNPDLRMVVSFSAF